MKIVVKHFHELTTKEVYNILQLRSEVFVVEQECIYQDIDGKDQKAIHVFFTENNKTIAYSRIFNEGEYFENPSIGRVLVAKAERGNELGKKIMIEGAKYIKENSDCKVIFNGDGADELMGGYLYFKHAPTKNDFDNECKRLLNDIHMFDVLRSDKSISSNGLEPRTPFLDREWVEFYLSINKELRYETTIDNCEKYLIRQAFNKNNNKLLPDEILWRTKEAFSDGVSSLNKSWFEIINEKIDKINDNNIQYNIINTGIQYKNSDKYINVPQSREQCYYRYLFNKHYNGCDSLIEYFWMPKFVNAKDASARTLNIYKKNNTNSIDIQ